MSPITTTITMPITTIPRKSVNMVAELALWIPDTTERPGGLLCSTKATTATAVALDTKARAAQGTVVQLKSELAQSQQSRTEAKTQVDSLSLIALNPPSDIGADTVVDRIPGRLIGESLDRLGNPTFRLGLQSQEQNQEQPIRLDEDQLTTDTSDLQMTEKTLAGDTAAFEDITKDCLVCQIKVADFEAYNKSLSEELEMLAKAKDVISGKTDNSEYRDNRSMLSSHGSLASSLIKSEHSIELVQLPSRVASAMHAETSYGDDPFAKVKGSISDMISRLEEKASEDATPQAFEATQTTSQHKDLCLTTSMISFALCSWPEVMIIMLMCDMKIKWIDHSQGVPLDELKRTRQEAEDVDDVQNIEMIAVKSCKSSDHSGWNGWQSIVIETEYGDAWVDKADENSQSLEMYNSMRQTTGSEREAKDQITEQANKNARNGGRRYREPSEISKIESVESKDENEKLSVKMRLTKVIYWNQTKFGDDAEKPISDDTKKALAEATQLIGSMLGARCWKSPKSSAKIKG